MERFKGTKGNWSIGIPGTVVSDNGDNTPENTGHDDTEYYGGYLVCESIASKADAQLISASPELLRVLNGMTLSMKAHPDYQFGRNQEFIDYVESAEEVISKALGV